MGVCIVWLQSRRAAESRRYRHVQRRPQVRSRAASVPVERGGPVRAWLGRATLRHHTRQSAPRHLAQRGLQRIPQRSLPDQVLPDSVVPSLLRTVST